MSAVRTLSRPGAGMPATIAWVAAALLLAWAIVYWAWRWVAPAPDYVIPAEPRDSVATIAASGWLAGSLAPEATAPPASTLSGDVRLLGVFAESGGGGYALFRLSSGPKLVRSGGEIASGSTLVAVAPDSIRIRDAGGERAIALFAPPTPRAGSAATKVAVMRNAAACAPPAGFRGPVVKLNAELLQGLVAQPEALRAIVTPVQGGMSVRDSSGFAQMIGLKAGDRVSLANGIALASAEDVMGAVLTPLIANQQVRLSGTRDGVAREMLLLNAGACPG